MKVLTDDTVLLVAGGNSAGYGLCSGCVDFASRGLSPEEIERSYGKRGLHYDLPADEIESFDRLGQERRAG